MTFKKGQSGNPKGRPKLGKAQRDDLERALRKVAKEKDASILEHFARRAYENDTVLVAVMKKIIPDLKHTEANTNVHSSGQLVIKWEK